MKRTPEFQCPGNGPGWPGAPEWGLVDRDWGDDDDVIWLDPETEELPSGSCSSHRSGLDTRTGLPVAMTEFRHPGGRLESRVKTSLDQFGYRTVRGEHRRPDGSLEFKSYVCTDPRTGHLLGEYKAYRPDGSLERWDRNYFGPDGNSVAETCYYGPAGQPGPRSRRLANPRTGHQIEQIF